MTSVAVAALMHESNGFVTGSTALAAFTTLRGHEIDSRPADRSALGGVIDAIGARGWRLVPTLAMHAWPSAPCERQVVDGFVRAVVESLQDHEGIIDGLMLVMHGAMLADGIDDVEGEVVTRLRLMPRLRALPVVVVLDLHANTSDLLAGAVDAIVAFRRNPHDDMHEAGVRGVAILERLLSSGRRGRCVRCASGALLAPIDSATDDEPMRHLEAEAREIEALDSEVLEAAVFAGFPYADHVDIGMSICVSALTESSLDRARTSASSALAHQPDWSPTVVEADPAKIVASIRRSPPGPVVVAEPGDNIGGGAFGDGTGLVRILLDHDVGGPSLVVLCDPVGVRRCSGTIPGARIRLAIGGRSFASDPGPLEREWTLRSLSDGAYALEDPKGPLSALHGPVVRMGPCAVVSHGSVTVLLTSVPSAPWDLGQWRSQGVAPENFRVIGVKSAAAHRSAYRSIASAWLSVDTPGPCPSNLSGIRYSRYRGQAAP